LEEDLPDGITGTETHAYLLIKKYLLNHDSITTTVAVKLIGKSAPTVRKNLGRLVSLGLLEANGSNKNRTYSLAK
ncbi:Fic family protein, partial [Ligilactobacillus sp. WILCCON 0076]|nr:Fic family protein [Ligilactobacillus ubinensis]